MLLISNVYDVKKQSIINKQKRDVSAASALVDHMLIELYLQNWVPGLQSYINFWVMGQLDV